MRSLVRIGGAPFCPSILIVNGLIGLDPKVAEALPTAKIVEQHVFNVKKESLQM